MQSPANPALNTAFHCENPRWQRRYEQALEGLAANVRLLPCYPRPVLQEGGMYQGIWLECGPHEGALYGEYDPQIARNNHEIFWDLAREDGFIPPFIRETPGDGQLQTVVPLAQTALECAQKLGQESLLARGYEACARYDAWLGQYRDSRGTGLVELHCEWDSGHDNSPRHAGLKQHCPGYDARQRDSLPGLPLLAPDLSATKYLGRVALAQMARLLGRAGEEAMWLERAEALRQQILRLTFDADTGFFLRCGRAGALRARQRGRGLARADVPRAGRSSVRANSFRPRAEPRRILDALSSRLHRGRRAGLQSRQCGKLLGRGQPSARSAARAAVAGILPAVRCAGGNHAPLAGSADGVRRVPPADESL
ncbi:MAG: hypothetical protein KHX36_12815 [Clostridiales bacterium]|nr:hypothetical protein [Clostridiales bacterium]